MTERVPSLPIGSGRGRGLQAYSEQQMRWIGVENVCGPDRKECVSIGKSPVTASAVELK